MKKIKQRLPQMHFACSSDILRPSMTHVEITKESVTASDAHILVTHKTNEIFSNEFIEAMPEKFYLHKNVWRDLSKTHIIITFENDLIVQYMDGYKMYYAPVVEPEWKYPLWESIMPKGEAEPISAIRLNFNLFDNFKKAFFMPWDSQKQPELTFFGPLAGVLITNRDTESRGLIMPCGS